LFVGPPAKIVCLKKKQVWLNKTKKGSGYACMPKPTKAPKPTRPPQPTSGGSSGGSSGGATSGGACTYEAVVPIFNKELKKKFPTSTYVYNADDFKFFGKSGNGNLKVKILCGGKPKPDVFIKCRVNGAGKEKWAVTFKKEPADFLLNYC